MDKQPLIDRGILIPIGISVFSILGIFIALLFVYLDKPQTIAAADPTATPFKYLFLGTETSVPEAESETPPPEETFEETFPEESTDTFPINTPDAGFPTLPIETSSQSPLLATNTLPASIAIPTVTIAASNVTERYDDTDPLLEYDGDWESETSVGNAYQQTLMVSNTIGNDVIFSFVGRQLIIGYLGEPSLGSIAISIDDNEFQLNQSVGKEWVSPQFNNEEHFVILIHEDGDSVNLDYINVVGSN